METNAGFGGFETELEDFVVRKTRDFDRAWKLGKGGSICGSVSDGGVAYFGDLNGNFYALDLATGKLKWTYRTNDRIVGTPFVLGERVFIGSYDRHFYCFEKGSGKLLWKFQTSSETWRPAYANGDRAYIGDRNGYLYCVDIASGKEVWKFRTGHEIGTGAVVHENRVYFGSFDGYFYCTDMEGKEIWRFRAGDHVQLFAIPSVHDGVVFFGSFDNYMYAVDAESGKMRWRFRTGQYGNSGRVVKHKDRFYLPSRDGIVYCLSKEGKEIWRFRAECLVANLTIHGERVYFGSEDNNLYCLDLEGKEIWRFRAGGVIFDTPVISGGRVCFSCWDCHYYCIDLNTRDVVWRFDSFSLTEAYLPPPYDTFNIQVKSETVREEDPGEDKYGVNVSEDRDMGSEYSVKSEYVVKNEYA